MGLEVRPVGSKHDLTTFIKLPWRLYRGDPNWVPPLIAERRGFLDPTKNPWFEHGEAQCFLAWRERRAVGRISAQVDRVFNEFQGNDWGLFGFFECEEDPEAASALLDAAAGWLRERGRDRMVGPADFTLNDECGVLVDGFELPPIILTNQTKPYYPALLEGAGMTKAMDTLMWELNVSQREQVHQAIWDVADRVQSEHGITVRPMRKRNLAAEIDRFLEVYNAAWERNWGFSPLTENEVRHYAKTLKPILDENWAFIAEKDGETVGAALSVPDFNQVLRHLNGRLLPFGWIKALWYRRKIDRVRVFALGVKREYQHTGVAALFYQLHFDSAERTPQKGAETGWILESNKPMNRAMEGMGGRVVRRYRIYDRALANYPAGHPADPRWSSAPLSFQPDRKHALILLGTATVAFTVILELIDPSHVSSGPGIIAFEFAATQSRAAQIMAEWGAKGHSAAHLSLVLDYGYMLSYGLFFALAGFAVRDTARARGRQHLAAIGVVVPFFALAAAAFDASENVALLLTLAGNGGSFAPPFAAVCSTIKFALIGIAILYALCGLARGFQHRLLLGQRSPRSKEDETRDRKPARDRGPA